MTDGETIAPRTDADKRAAARQHLGSDPTYRTYAEYASSPWNAWLGVVDEPDIQGLHATLVWNPFISSTNCVKVIGYEREDGAGFTVPTEDGRWWVAWQHPMSGRGMGWHHHALGTYSSATAAAMAFDKVYDLERLAGNVDRMTRADRAAHRDSGSDRNGEDTEGG